MTEQSVDVVAQDDDSYIPGLQSIKQFSEANPAYTESALRNLTFKAEPRQSTVGTIPGNGLIEAGAILRVGRKVLIDPPRRVCSSTVSG